MIAVVFALPEESREFRRAIGATRATSAKGSHWHGEVEGRAILITHCGVGHAAAADAATALLSGQRPDLLITTGFAGALDPRLAIGDLVVGENVSDPNLLAVALKCGVAAAAGILTTAEHTVETVAAKRALAASGALAVDMETAAIASACRIASVPLLAARAISDRADDPLPVPFAIWFDINRQRPRILPLLTYLTTHPTRIAPFAHFVRGLRPAREALAAFLIALLRNVALPKAITK